MVLWLVAVVALLAALAALTLARRAGRRMDAITQSYWELRYEHTRLRSQLSRLDPDDAAVAPPAPAAPATASVSFVPLSTMRKKDK